MPVNSHFEMATEEEICNIVSRASLATCDLDPIPSSFIKDNIDVLAPAIRDIVNLSLKSGDCPAPLKKAVVVPLLKRKGLDTETLKNYRPVSNLSFISKIVEQVVAKRLRDHLSSNELWGKTQSAYRAFHSTETALLRVQNDIFSCMDKKKLMALVMLDLSAAFDTIDHNILLRRLESRFGIKGVALQWIKSYLSQRKQSVKFGNTISDPIELFFGVPKGSVLGPLFFSLYISPMSDIAESHSIGHMFYADDLQLYTTVNPRHDNHVGLAILESCINNIKDWMQVNFLKINDSKTEFVMFGSKHNLSHSENRNIKVGNHQIATVETVHNLGAQMDKHLSMDSFIQAKSKSITFQLRTLRRIRKFLTDSACRILVQATIQS